MPTTPVIVTAWVDPPELSDVPAGTTVTWHALCVDRITREPVSPDIITFSWSNPPVAINPLTATPTQDATGEYHQDTQITGAGTWLLQVIAQGNPGAVTIGSNTLYLCAVAEVA